MSAPLCAHGCELVDVLVGSQARDRGLSVETVRVGLGLTSEYVPPIPPRDPARHMYRCGHGQSWPSPLLAAECPCLPINSEGSTL